MNDAILPLIGISYVIAIPVLTFVALFNFLHEFDDYETIGGFFASFLIAPIIFIIHLFKHFLSIRNTEREYYILEQSRNTPTPKINRTPNIARPTVSSNGYKPTTNTTSSEKTTCSKSFIQSELRKAYKAKFYSDYKVNLGRNYYIDITGNVKIEYFTNANVYIDATVQIDKYYIEQHPEEYISYKINEDIMSVLEPTIDGIKSALFQKWDQLYAKYYISENLTCKVQLTKNIVYK